ncbi:MAG: PD40 domain-containing protein [Acidobacteria bacterium]|nr:PD40 domain-containing protein [Acidobacteriota bacterium]
MSDYASSRSGRLNIWRSDLGESNSVQLTYGEIDNWPALSADGKTIYYESLNRRKLDHLEGRVEGRAPEQLTSAGNAGSPVPRPTASFGLPALSQSPGAIRYRCGHCRPVEARQDL